MSKHRHPSLAGTLGQAAALAVLLGLGVAPAAGQIAPDAADRLPQVIPDVRRPVDQSLEFGLTLGRYDYDGSDVTSGFDGQFARYTRARPTVDMWRLDVGRQGRFGETSLDGGLSYTRYLGATSVSAGISGGTSEILANRYRLDLGVTRPIAGFNASAGYTRAQSYGDNSSDGWSVGLVRWFPHLIVGAGYRRDYGRPGDTQSSTYNLGATYYVWRRTYLGGGVSWGEVSYQLVGGGTPLATAVLVDYKSWSAFLAATRYLTDHSGINLRWDHSRARDIWTIDGVTASYFHEW